MSRAALAPGHAREYETVYILRPNTDREQADSVATRILDALSGFEGKITDAELWGQRRLAYPIAKHFRGIYVYLKYLGRGATVAEIERQLRLADSVIRFQTIQLRDNVPVASEEGRDGMGIEFDVPFEPDEPEVPRERELGLDAPPPERRPRRDDRMDDDSDDDESPNSTDDSDDSGRKSDSEDNES
jgi:small subunit ribosomal protein S6